MSPTKPPTHMQTTSLKPLLRAQHRWVQRVPCRAAPQGVADRWPLRKRWGAEGRSKGGSIRAAALAAPAAYPALPPAMRWHRHPSLQPRVDSAPGWFGHPAAAKDWS